MQVFYSRVCGIDVHKELIVACVLMRDGDGTQHSEVRHFEAYRKSLLALKAWLCEREVELVGMEATGTYWVPVWEVLEEAQIGCQRLSLQLCNAREVKNVPGNKTDKRDASWLAQLLMHGLIRASFVPGHQMRELRDVLRTRRSMVETRTNHQNQVAELLERAQIKLDSVVSDLFGRTGLAILTALANGSTDPTALAHLAYGSLRKKRHQLALALDGRFHAGIQGRLRCQLAVIEAADKQIAALDAEAAQLLAERKHEVKLLCTMPGIAETTARIIVAEIGIDMSIWGTADRLASWAGICPGNNESAGKPIRGRDSRIRPGNRYLKTALIQAAWAATRVKGCRFRSMYFRFKARLGGAQQAIVAIAHALLRVIFALLDSGKPYIETALPPFTETERQRRTNKLLRELRRLGYPDVTLGQLTPAWTRTQA